MTLRLAGEDYSVVAGLDGLGWLRDIKATSSDPALKVDQKGSGSILDLLDSGTPVLRFLNGGNLAFLVGKAPAAGQYEMGRNADATNRLQYNVPTGALHELSVNDVNAFTVDSGGFIAYSGGSQKVKLQNNSFELSTGLSFQATGFDYGNRYALVRVTGTPNYLSIGVPSGAFTQFDIAGVAQMTLNATGLSVVNALEIDGALNHDGATVGLYGAAPVAQAVKINDPSGGATQDAEARTAINALVDALEGIGIASAV